jgi:hypothetical protein
MNGRVMDDKWKAFAVGQVLSSYSDRIEPEALFDRIMQTDDAGLRELFRECDVLVWEPFAQWDYALVANHMSEMAEVAQQTAGPSAAQTLGHLAQPQALER